MQWIYLFHLIIYGSYFFDLNDAMNLCWPEKYAIDLFLILVNIPVEGIRLLDAVCLLQRCGLSLVSSALKKWHLTYWPVDLFKKEPLKGNSEVHLHTPTKFGEDPSKDLGGVGKQTNKQTDRQTNAARIIVWFLRSKFLENRSLMVIKYGHPEPAERPQVISMY